MITDTLFDFALLVVSSCAALYCWTLSRRLRGLQNLKKGVGKAMVNLTKTVTQVEYNAERLNREAQAAVAELGAMLARVDSCEEKVDILLETMDRQSRETWKDYRRQIAAAKSSADRATDELNAIIEEARHLSGEMDARVAELSDDFAGLSAAFASAAEPVRRAAFVEEDTYPEDQDESDDRGDEEDDAISERAAYLGALAERDNAAAERIAARLAAAARPATPEPVREAAAASAPTPRSLRRARAGRAAAPETGQSETGQSETGQPGKGPRLSLVPTGSDEPGNQIPPRKSEASAAFEERLQKTRSRRRRTSHDTKGAKA